MPPGGHYPIVPVSPSPADLPTFPLSHILTFPSSLLPDPDYQSAKRRRRLSMARPPGGYVREAGEVAWSPREVDAPAVGSANATTRHPESQTEAKR